MPHELIRMVQPGPTSPSPGASRGIHWPRAYDLLLWFMTHGRDTAYRGEVLDLAGVVPGKRVLDVGCGTGTQAIAAWHRVQPGGSVVGIDVSPNMLAAARRKARRAGADVEFREGDAAALPFEDGTFDVVSLTTVMHMVPERRRMTALQEAARVLAPGGRLLLIDYAGDPDRRRGLVAKHGMHRIFDLGKLIVPMYMAGFMDVEGGPLGWLDLHFLRGAKASAEVG